MPDYPYDVYAEQLLHKGLGYALWQPEQSAENGGVQIGDVGIISQGGFQPLFNAHTHTPNGDDGIQVPESRPLKNLTHRL